MYLQQDGPTSCAEFEDMFGKTSMTLQKSENW